MLVNDADLRGSEWSIMVNHDNGARIRTYQHYFSCIMLITVVCVNNWSYSTHIVYDMIVIAD